jgi:hypothetical protein
VGDRFVELYRRVRLGQDGLINAGITLPATISANTIPDEYSDIYYIRPQSIAALDLKLREDLLSLMESREFYQGKMLQSRRDSGLHLLDKLLDEQARADLTHASNTAVIDAKIRLENLRFHPTLRRAHHGRHSQIAVATNRHHAPNKHRSLFARQSHLYLPTHSWTSAIDPISARRALQRRHLERYASTSRRSPSRSRFRRRRRRQSAKHIRDA